MLLTAVLILGVTLGLGLLATAHRVDSPGTRTPISRAQDYRQVRYRTAVREHSLGVAGHQRTPRDCPECEWVIRH